MSEDTENKTRNFKVDFYFDWTCGIKIKRLREDLDKLEKLGVTEIDIELENDFGFSSIGITAYANRLETNKEYKERINKEKKHKDNIERMELEQLLKLQDKYKK